MAAVSPPLYSMAAELSISSNYWLVLANFALKQPMVAANADLNPTDGHISEVFLYVAIQLIPMESHIHGPLTHFTGVPKLFQTPTLLSSEVLNVVNALQ